MLRIAPVVTAAEPSPVARRRLGDRIRLLWETIGWNANLRAAQSEIGRLRDELVVGQEALASSQRLCEEKTQALSAATRRAADAEERVRTARIERDEALARARREAAERAAALSRAAELPELRRELLARNEALARAQETAAQHETVATQAAHAVAESAATLSRIRAELAERDDALARLRERVAIQSAALTEALTARDQNAGRVNELQQALAQSQEAVYALRRDLAQREGALVEATENAQAIAAELARAEMQLAARDAAHHDLSSSRRELASRLAIAEGRLAEMEQRLQSQSATVSAQRWDLEGVRAQLAAALAEGGEKAAEIQVLQREIKTLGRRIESARGLAEADRKQLDLLRKALSAALQDSDDAAALLIASSGLFDEDYYRAQCRGPVPEGIAAIVHYLRIGDRQGCDPHPLFRRSFYLAQLPRPQIGRNALLHFLGEGGGFAANPLFSPSYYREQYPEIEERGLNPLVHYVLVGEAAGAQPHPLFDPGYYGEQIETRGQARPAAPLAHYLSSGPSTASPHRLFDPDYYLRACPEAAEAGQPALVHYLLKGDREGRSPHSYFHTGYYRRANPEIGSHENALVHYVTRGAAAQRSPNPLFDPSFYRSKYPDLAEKEMGIELIFHFGKHGQRERRSPHPLIDIAFVAEQLRRWGEDDSKPWNALLSPANIRRISPNRLFDIEYYMSKVPRAAQYPSGPLLYYLAEGWRQDDGTHPLFDPAFYRAQAKERSIEVTDPLAHFLATGRETAISPHWLFDAAFYLRANPDVAEGKENPLIHYLGHGDRENRDPHRLFSVAYYREEAGISFAENSLLHYLREGGAVGLDPHPLFDTKYYLAGLKQPLPPETTPLAHYLGGAPGAEPSPHPLFDLAFYCAQLDAAPAGGRPALLHYLEQPPEQAPSPHPLFDRDFFHDTVGYRETGLLEYVSTLRSIGRPAYRPHKMHFQEANRDFCSISYLLDHPELMDGRDIPMVHYVRSGRWKGARPSAGTSGGPETPAIAGPYQPAILDPQALRNAAEEQMARGLDHLAANDLPSRAPGSEEPLAALWKAAAPHATLSAGDPGLMRRVGQSGRLAVYAVYCADGGLKAYHKATLRALDEAGYPAILVNGAVAGAGRLAQEAADLAAAVIVRGGEGRDFASWLVALNHFAPVLGRLDNLLLLNDSLVGPFGDLAQTIWNLEANPADFKGLTESLEESRHFQSSFLMLSRHALFSRSFLRFIDEYARAASGALAPLAPASAGRGWRPSARHRAVRGGEVRLSRLLLSSGVAGAAAAPHREILAGWLDGVPRRVEAAREWTRGGTAGLHWLSSGELRGRIADCLVEWLLDRAGRLRAGERMNPQHIFWDALLAAGSFPFIKKELLLTNPLHVPTLVELPSALATGGRNHAALLRDLLPPNRATELPPAYFRLSEPLLEAIPD